MKGWMEGLKSTAASNRQLQELFKASQVALSPQKLDELLAKLLRIGMESLSMPAGSIALYEEETRQLVLHAHRGLSPQFVARDRWVVEEGDVTQRILQRGEVFVIEDTQMAFSVTPWPLEKEGIRSLVASPLKCRNNVVGIFYLDDFEPRQIHDSQIQMFSIIASFAALCIDNAQIRNQADFFTRTDPLTRLYNQHQFKALFQQELSRSQYYGFPFSLILFDIDDFRRFNDSFGHSNGDLVLKTVARLLRESFREFDTLFRYGGEEFMAILPETPLEEALKLAREGCHLIAQKSHRDLPVAAAGPVSASAAVVSFPKDGRNLDTLLRHLDTLLFLHRHVCGQVHTLPDAAVEI